MSTTTTQTTAKTERELVAICRRIEELGKLNDRKVHLFMDLRGAGVTQARIGELAGMSDVGVKLAIDRHAKRHAKAVDALAAARDEDERASASEGLCHICQATEEPVTADA